jgi:hypothetical protein
LATGLVNGHTNPGDGIFPALRYATVAGPRARRRLEKLAPAGIT